MLLIKCSSETSVVASIDNFNQNKQLIFCEKNSRNLLDPSDSIRDKNRMYSFPWRRRSTASHIPPHVRIRIDRRLRFDKFSLEGVPICVNILQMHKHSSNVQVIAKTFMPWARPCQMPGF
jgi:hypothetical protein